MISNKLIIKLQKSRNMIFSKRTLDTFNFNVLIHHNKIQKNCLKYSGFYIDDKFTWKN